MSKCKECCTFGCNKSYTALVFKQKLGTGTIPSPKPMGYMLQYESLHFDWQRPGFKPEAHQLLASWFLDKSLLLFWDSVPFSEKLRNTHLTQRKRKNLKIHIYIFKLHKQDYHRTYGISDNDYIGGNLFEKSHIYKDQHHTRELTAYRCILHDCEVAFESRWVEYSWNFILGI